MIDCVQSYTIRLPDPTKGSCLEIFGITVFAIALSILVGGIDSFNERFSFPRSTK